MKIFVSGLYGTGKSTLAKKIVKEKDISYFNFDDLWNYSASDSFSEQCDALFNGNLKEESYVVDAIPYSSNENEPLDKFLKFCSENKDVLILFTFCSDFNVWLKRLDPLIYPVLFGKDKENFRQNHHHMNRVYVDKVEKYILLFYDSVQGKYVLNSEFRELTSWVD